MTLDDCVKDSGFRLTPPLRQLIMQVKHEATGSADRQAEPGAWLFTFARLAAMSKTELKRGGCPADQTSAFMAFALDRAIDLAAPTMPCRFSWHPFDDLRSPAVRPTSELLARVARLKWGTAAAAAVYAKWTAAQWTALTGEFADNRH
jgi:hypothetical protein